MIRRGNVAAVDCCLTGAADSEPSARTRKLSIRPGVAAVAYRKVSAASGRTDTTASATQSRSPRIRIGPYSNRPRAGEALPALRVGGHDAAHDDVVAGHEPYRRGGGAGGVRPSGQAQRHQP